jgi:succinate-semialdehyde dehydrogenase/glutarate-semialdehyde dehydrogenase
VTDLLEDLPSDLLIGGEWRQATSGERFVVSDPASTEGIVEVANGTMEDAQACVDAAARAFDGWAATPPRQRGEVLRRAFELMIEREDELAELITRENGKALPDALGEVRYSAEFFRWYSEEAVRIDSHLARAPGGANRILHLRQPVGVSILVTPWNFPAAMATRKIGPALAAGCTVVLKPASETPLTALLLGRLVEQAGAPPGVVNVLPSRQSSKVVNAMLDDPRVRKLSFTGSTEVGRVLLRKAAERIVNCSMELGGNTPFLVFADSDLDAAVDSAMVAKMRNGGESCIAANRFYVERSVADEFAERMGDRMAGLKVGPGLEEGVQVGPLVSESERDKVAEMVEQAVDDGVAKVVTGGAVPDRRGWFYTPTVLADVDAGAELIRQEIFGPVAPVTPFDTEDEAVALANDTEFGLAAYLHTGDLARGLRVAERIEAGIIGLNRGFVSDPAAPFGGMKQSGLGREGGHDGLLEFCESKYVAVDW